MQGGVQNAFDPCVFHVVEQDAAVALFESLRVTFEDVEEFLNKSIVIPDKDVAIPHISADGDALVFRRGGVLFIRHADVFFRGYPRYSLYYTTSFSLTTPVFHRIHFRALKSLPTQRQAIHQTYAYSPLPQRYLWAN